jgi:NNP family nitrate/nitrite transporter-like MFS transporter
MCSVLVLFLGPEYGFTPVDTFLLTAVPTLVGAALRLPDTFAVASFGGRPWTTITMLALLVPLALISSCTNPASPSAP